MGQGINHMKSSGCKLRDQIGAKLVVSAGMKVRLDSMSLKQRMASGERLVGTFLKTPSYELIEVLAKSGLDFLILDAEHAPFDRARLDQCLALGRALGFPLLVRVPNGEASSILQVLDSGAVGVVVPHVDSVEKAQSIARSARFGHGGRGFAGSTRWAGFATRKMEDILAQSPAETIVVAQIEEPEGVDCSAAIAAIDGIDALFAGPADLAVCYGTTEQSTGPVEQAMRTTGESAKAHGKAYATFAANSSATERLAKLGVTMFCVASEHAFMLHTARTWTQEIKAT